MSYLPSKIEKKWQKYWAAKKLYRASDNSKKSKYYQLETFPYPSAAGLHVGHPKGYIAEDIHARYMRMNGHEVLYTMGWDAFGLPTENYAIKIGKSPKDVAAANIKTFKRQVQMFGLSYDWEREINTSSPEYYRWTQWLFLELYKKGLAYKAKAKVNWCPKDQTVLANEQVIDGRCERDGELVVQKEMDQWFFKITEYADRLLSDMQGLDWPAATIKRQVDWIGRSKGARIIWKLRVPGQPDHHTVETFTTRPDTIYGATFLVISPEKAKEWLDIGWEASKQVKDYVAQSLRRRELERKEGTGDKTGVVANVHAINPLSGELIAVWVADYVLGSYGTGAIMAVPAHDQRDAQFAEKFGLPFSDTALRDSEEVVRALKAKNAGGPETTYKLRDWSVSRQRYWGVPIPIIYCSVCGSVPVPARDLPVLLPAIADYRPRGMPPLASSEKFMAVKCPTCKGPARRDPETLDTFVDSSWYFLRYTDPKNTKQFADARKLAHWMPVDLYVIGAEHTVLHLLYSRFITKFLHDQGYLKHEEPFLKLRHVGLILGNDGQKMSKSKGNVVNPDPLIAQFGADTVRVYEMFMGPFENGQPWDTKGVVGSKRFLDRVYGYVTQVATRPAALTPQSAKVSLARTIKKVGDDIRAFKFNTAISALMVLLNDLEGVALARNDIEDVVKILSPFAPHLAEELWQAVLRKKTSVHRATWPKLDPQLLVVETVQIPVQVNGRVRGMISLAPDATEQDAVFVARQDENVSRHLGDREPGKIIYLPGRLINFVVQSVENNKA